MFVQFSIRGEHSLAVLSEKAKTFRRGIKVAGRAALGRIGARKADERKAKSDTLTMK